MIDTLSRLIEYPTVTADRDANHDALDHVSEYFADRGMYTYPYQEFGYRSIIASTRPGLEGNGPLDAKVMIASHLDVVPAESTTAFIPKQRGDKLYGRGALDMKFNIAATMEIIDELYREGTLSQYDIALMITTDEEVGGMYGTKLLLDRYGYRPEVCIIPDGGDNWQIQTSSKGFLHYVIRADGEMVHSRAPYEGSNAILKASRAMLAVQDLFPNEGPETNTNSPNMVHGGRAVNQTADLCEYSLDARFINEAEKRRLRAEIGRVCLEHGAEMIVQVDGASANFDLANPYIAPFRKLVTAVTDIEVEGSRTLGSSDARFFAAHGIPCISLYPTGGGHHSENEWISIKAAHQYKDILRMYLDQMARVPELTPEAAAEREKQN